MPCTSHSPPCTWVARPHMSMPGGAECAGSHARMLVEHGVCGRYGQLRVVCSQRLRQSATFHLLFISVLTQHSTMTSPGSVHAQNTYRGTWVRAHVQAPALDRKGDKRMASRIQRHCGYDKQLEGKKHISWPSPCRTCARASCLLAAAPTACRCWSSSSARAAALRSAAIAAAAAADAVAASRCARAMSLPLRRG